MRIIAAILAAGQSDRFGGNKQLAATGGIPMIRRVCSAVTDAAPDAVVLVAGREALAVHDAADVPFLVINEHYADGLGTSVAAAANRLAHAADALLVCLGDQPLVPASHFAALIDSWEGDPHAIVASGYGDTTGVPALFGSGHFDALARLSGDQGARSVFAAAGDKLCVIACEEAAFDVDTDADLEAVNRLL